MLVICLVLWFELCSIAARFPRLESSSAIEQRDFLLRTILPPEKIYIFSVQIRPSYVWCDVKHQKMFYLNEAFFSSKFLQTPQKSRRRRRDLPLWSTHRLWILHWNCSNNCTQLVFSSFHVLFFYSNLKQSVQNFLSRSSQTSGNISRNLFCLSIIIKKQKIRVATVSPILSLLMI